MPLKSTAAGVSQAFHEPTIKRIDQKVVDKLEQLEIVTTYVRAALDAAVTAYFSDRDARGLPPYEWSSGSYDAKIDVMTSEAFASGNNPDLETAIRTLDERLTQEVKDRATKECTDAGFNAWVVFDPAAPRLVVTLSDRGFKEIREDWAVQERVHKALGDV